MKFVYVFLAGLCLTACGQTPLVPSKIDRYALVNRHNITVTAFDSLSSLSVGNGKFAFTVDATGLQTFPGLYKNGVSLGTFSEWGWHSFPNTEKFRYQEILKPVNFHSREITYNEQWKEPERKRKAADYFRQNPHRIHLGAIGLDMENSNGRPIQPTDIKAVSQKLNLWEGTIYSQFSIDGEMVNVETICDPVLDQISVRIISKLVSIGRIKLRLSFPYPSGEHVDDGCNWLLPEKHTSEIIPFKYGAEIKRKIDTTQYSVNLRWNGNAEIQQNEPHQFIIAPKTANDTLTFSGHFSQVPTSEKSDFTKNQLINREYWKNFWLSGGAVDFYGSSDLRATELERRVVLSQYLTKIQCAGKYPPQETGLTFNSWYGKFHLEMHWWHAVHFALWKRSELLEQSLDWYREILPQAETIATRQGFTGARWPKMVGPNGIDSPSSVGAFLIWQQPHFIYLAELCFRNSPDTSFIRKWSDLVFKSADFMASYAWLNTEKNKYQLGPWLIPAQERLPAETTINPPFELSYWFWGLNTAQLWRERLNMQRNADWDKVIDNLAPLAQSNGLYIAAESAEDSYSNPKFMGDHPSVLGALGMMPTSPLVDRKTMRNTYNYILQNWDWESTWGWDYPMMAMTATRLGMPEQAVDALLMPVQKNRYLVNGHNYQDKRLRIYLPGNGGLLAAVAIMCAGYDGCTTKLPGFPKDGTWKVRWENLQKMP